MCWSSKCYKAILFSFWLQWGFFSSWHETVLRLLLLLLMIRWLIKAADVQVFQCELQWTIPPPCSTPACCTLFQRRLGTAFVTLTRRMSWPSCVFAPKGMRSWSLQVILYTVVFICQCSCLHIILYIFNRVVPDFDCGKSKIWPFFGNTSKSGPAKLLAGFGGYLCNKLLL